MKRAMALLLVLVLAFALCGCGKKAEATIIETSTVKVGDDEYTSVHVSTPDANAGAASASGGKQYDVIVEDCALAWESGNYVHIKPKVHNCTDRDAAYLLVNCQLVDKDGRTIRVTGCDTGGVAAGANEWVSGTIQISKDEASKTAEFVFSGGGFDISKDGKCYRQTVSFAETSFTKEYVLGE